MEDVWSKYDLLYGQGTSGTTYPMLRRFNQLQIVAENEHFICEFSFQRKMLCFFKCIDFSIGNPVVNVSHFDVF